MTSSATTEGWTEIARDPAETETGLQATPANAEANATEETSGAKGNSGRGRGPRNNRGRNEGSRGGRPRGEQRSRGENRGRGGRGGRNGKRGDANGANGAPAVPSGDKA